MRRAPRPFLPAVYGALFEISTMRDQLAALRGDLSDADAARFVARLDAAEAVAVRLLERFENGRGSVVH